MKNQIEKLNAQNTYEQKKMSIKGQCLAFLFFMIVAALCSIVVIGIFTIIFFLMS